MKQREGVFAAVSEVLGETAFNGKVSLNDTQKEQVYAHIMAGFRSGTITHRNPPADDKELKKYTVGLVNNWMRKDKALNGGVKYEVKNPGSRTGSGDESLKNAKLLLSVTEEAEARQQIQAYITRRIGELKPKKTIDLSALPPELQKFVPA